MIGYIKLMPRGGSRLHIEASQIAAFSYAEWRDEHGRNRYGSLILLKTGDKYYVTETPETIVKAIEKATGRGEA